MKKLTKAKTGNRSVRATSRYHGPPPVILNPKYSITVVINPYRVNNVLFVKPPGSFDFSKLTWKDISTLAMAQLINGNTDGANNLSATGAELVISSQTVPFTFIGISAMHLWGPRAGSVRIRSSGTPLAVPPRSIVHDSPDGDDRPYATVKNLGPLYWDRTTSTSAPFLGAVDYNTTGAEGISIVNGAAQGSVVSSYAPQFFEAHIHAYFW